MLLQTLLSLLNDRIMSGLVVILVAGVLLSAITRPARITQQFVNLISKVIHIYLCQRYRIKDVSGQRSLPTCPYKWPNGQGDVGKFLQGIENSVSWEKDHGQIYRIWSGMRSEIVLTRPEHLQVVFNDSDRHDKAADNNSGYIMSQMLGQCVGLISGQKWQRLRTVSEVPFLHKNASTYVPTIQRHVESHFAGLSQNENLKSNLIHPAEDLKFLPFWIVTEIIYGQLTPELIAHLKVLIPQREELFKYVIQGGLSRFSWMRYFPHKAGKALVDFKTQWQSFNETTYQSALGSPSPPPIVSMVDAVSSGSITTEQLHQTLDEALFANLDVTTGGISWNLVFLAANPECQQRLLEEITSTDPADFNDYVLSSSTYLASCISESSRLKPLAAFSVPQSAPTDRVLGGFVVPAGTDFIVDSYALNVRSQYWGPDGAVYRPERFMEPRMNSTKLRYHFWRFGFGPRQCMGKYVADLIIRSLLVHLVRNFRLSPVGSEAVFERSPESWITHPDFLVRCHRREPERA